MFLYQIMHSSESILGVRENFHSTHPSGVYTFFQKLVMISEFFSKKSWKLSLFKSMFVFQLENLFFFFFCLFVLFFFFTCSSMYYLQKIMFITMINFDVHKLSWIFSNSVLIMVTYQRVQNLCCRYSWHLCLYRLKIKTIYF